MRWIFWALASLAACSASSPLDGWSDDALCAAGPIASDVALVPWPRAIRRLGPPVPLAAREIAIAPPHDALLAALARDTVLGAGDGGLRVELLDGDAVASLEARCGSSLDPSPEAFFLATRGSEAIIAARTEAGRSRGAALLAQLVSTEGLREAVVSDAPAQALRGVLEGFYGPPWSDDERVEMLRFVWRARMNTLVWAPKGELRTRIFWREPPSPELERHLRALAAEARGLAITFCAELSPGNGILYSDPSERALLLARLDRLASIGVPCLAVAFDDIPRSLRSEDRARYGDDLGRAQGELLAEVLAALAARHPGVVLGVVPTDYWTEAIELHPEYTRALAAALPEGVFVGWTGREIIAPSLTGEDVDRFTELWGRAPLVGDNYPVTDGARDRGRIQLGPVVGRDARAITAARGWVANALALPRASTIPLATVADQLWGPERYEPEASWDRALAWIGGPERAALRSFADHARASPLDTREAVALHAEIAAWLANYPARNLALEAHLTALTMVPGALTGPLAAELAPWTQQLAEHARAGLTLLALAESLRSGAAIDVAARAALEAEAARLSASPVRIAHDALDRLLAGGIAQLPR